MKAQVKVAWVGLLQATSPLINDQTNSTLFPKIPRSRTNLPRERLACDYAYRACRYPPDRKDAAFHG
jgi:hypothetical protein